jgi:hypothetical protein
MESLAERFAVRIQHHIPSGKYPARTRLTGDPAQFAKLTDHLRKSAHVGAVHRTRQSLVIYHENNLSGLICHIEAEGIAEVLDLPPGSNNILEQLGPGVLTAAAIILLWFLL